MQTIVAVSLEAIVTILNPDFHFHPGRACDGGTGLASRPSRCSITMPTLPRCWLSMMCPTAVPRFGADGYGFGTDGAAWGRTAAGGRAV